VAVKMFKAQLTVRLTTMATHTFYPTRIH